MLLGAFRPQTTTEDKKVTNSERSATQIYRKQLPLPCHPDRSEAERRDLRCVSIPPQLQGTSYPPPLPSREPVTFRSFRVFCISPNKAVILSETPRRSTPNTALDGAESKDPGSAYLTHAALSFSTTNEN